MRGLSPAIRAANYVWIMFPPWLLFPISAVQFLSLYMGMQALADSTRLVFGWHAAVGTATTIIWTLLIRVEDDLADADHDLRLGRAGDPRYRDRPIVSGAITVQELRRLYAGGLTTMLLINLAFGVSVMFFACVAGWTITWLGFRWFYIPSLRRHASPLAFLARKLLTILPGIYAFAVFVDDFGYDAVIPWFIPLLLAPWAGVSAWETARKIRVPEDETDYDTYSKQLGWRRAVWLPVLFTLISAVCVTAVSRAAGLGATFPLILLASAAVAVTAYLRFRIAPTRSHANLRPYAEFYGLVAHGGLTLALVLAFGVTVA
jgi:4-hydroxybenzoate polyprenyltransferase